MLLLRGFFGSLLSVINQGFCLTVIYAQLSYLGIQQNPQRWWAPHIEFTFLSAGFIQTWWGTQCGPYWSSSLNPVCHHLFPRALQSVPQHKYLLRSENSVSYLENTQPICRIPSWSRHYLAPQTALLKFSLKLTVFPWHTAVKFPTVASRCWERDTDPALIPTQYVCTSLLAFGNYADAARLTHQTELLNMWVCSHDSLA